MITLLNVLAAAIPARERVVTIEDSSVQLANPQLPADQGECLTVLDRRGPASDRTEG
jgi:hypothetical protein